MPIDLEWQFLSLPLMNLPQGTHLCPIYESGGEQFAVAVPFIKEGLKRGERCLYICDPLMIDELVEGLSNPKVDVALERGALRLLTQQQILPLSGEFSPSAMIDFLSRAQSDSLADGFSGLRVVGEMTWLLGADVDADRLMEFEGLLNKFVANSRSVVLCQYNPLRFDPALIHEILLTHPLVILGDSVCPNPYYEPLELVLLHDRMATAKFKRRRVDWWIAQLKEARARSLEREQLLQRLQTISRRLLEVQEAERRHLARELHDEVGQMLTALRLLLKPNGALSTDLEKTRCEQALGIVDELLERVRRLSFDLRPAALDHLGLLPALLALVERYTEQTGVRVDFKHHQLEVRFPPDVETTAYRIVQEALTNVARHASVKCATVRIWASADTVSVQVEDRGHGFDPEVASAAPRSSGLAGMQERVMLLEGRLTMESRPGGGTQITAELPLHGQSRRSQQ